MVVQGAGKQEQLGEVNTQTSISRSSSLPQATSSPHRRMKILESERFCDLVNTKWLRLIYDSMSYSRWAADILDYNSPKDVFFASEMFLSPSLTSFMTLSPDSITILYTWRSVIYFSLYYHLGSDILCLSLFLCHFLRESLSWLFTLAFIIILDLIYSVCLSFFVSFYVSFFLCLHRLSVFLSVSLSVCLSVCLYDT